MIDDLFSDTPTEKVELVIVKTGLRGALKKVSSLVLREGDETTTANKYGSVIVVCNAGKFYVTIYPGFVISCVSLESALSKMLMMFYVLNVEFPKSAASFFRSLARLHGDKTQKINSTTSALIKSL